MMHANETDRMLLPILGLAPGSQLAAPFVISTKSLRAHWCQTLFQSLINQPVGHVLQPTE